MGQFSVKIYLPTGSVLNGNQHTYNKALGESRSILSDLKSHETPYVITAGKWPGPSSPVYHDPHSDGLAHRSATTRLWLTGCYPKRQHTG